MKARAQEPDQFFQPVARSVELNTGWEHWASRRHVPMALKGDIAGRIADFQCAKQMGGSTLRARGKVDGNAFLRQSGPHNRHRSDGTAVLLLALSCRGGFFILNE